MFSKLQVVSSSYIPIQIITEAMKYSLCITTFMCLIMAWCSMSQEIPDYSQPVSPDVYADNMKQGFSATYFTTSTENGKPTPAKKYSYRNMVDIYVKRFHNIRLPVSADLYKTPYNDRFFLKFLHQLDRVVDRCIDHEIAPVVSWSHHEVEAFATIQDRENYLNWWQKVATRLQNVSYHLAFNLFTELRTDLCENDCSESLSENIRKYNDWTQAAINTIRESGGNNRERIIILTSPNETFSGLNDIDYSILLGNDKYLMVEWHDYATGPYNKEECTSNREKGCRLLWRENGNDEQRGVLKSIINEATNFRQATGIPSYAGAWMPRDSIGGTLTQQEVINFARFFAEETKKANIPWSLNVLDDYYNTKQNKWLTSTRNYEGARLNLDEVLENIREVM